MAKPSVPIVKSSTANRLVIPSDTTAGAISSISGSLSVPSEAKDLVGSTLAEPTSVERIQTESEADCSVAIRPATVVGEAPAASS